MAKDFSPANDTEFRKPTCLQNTYFSYFHKHLNIGIVLQQGEFLAFVSLENFISFSSA